MKKNLPAFVSLVSLLASCPAFAYGINISADAQKYQREHKQLAFNAIDVTKESAYQSLGILNENGNGIFSLTVHETRVTGQQKVEVTVTSLAENTVDTYCSPHAYDFESAVIIPVAFDEKVWLPGLCTKN